MPSVMEMADVNHNISHVKLSMRGGLHHTGWNMALWIIQDEVTAALQSS